MEFDLTETDTQLENANTRNKQNSQVELRSVDTTVDMVCGSSSMERVKPQVLVIAVISSLVLMFCSFFSQFIYFS
jgi:hypothetical protein